MPAFASIDLGSNASRLLVAEADDPRTVRRLVSDRVPVRLGHSVFLTGELDPRSIDQAIGALKRFRVQLERHGVSKSRAVVTAAARDAVNSLELLERAKDEAGVELEAISGSEEARLVKLAVSSRLPLEGKRSLLIDLGGGSLELSEVYHDEVRHSVSLEIGSVRLLESFLSPRKPVGPEQENLLTEYVDRMLAPVSEGFRRRRYDLVAGTGGNFDAVAALCPVPGRDVPTLDVSASRTVLRKMKRMTAAERRAAFDLRSDRADVIVPALFVIGAVAELARTEEIVAPGVGLREGILVELIDKHFRVWDYSVDEHATTRAALHLGRRFHFDEPHATQVDRLSCMLFDRLAPLHGFGPGERQLLRVAALLHDVGDFIASDEHHKHSQYVIEHSDLIGLSREQRSLVALIARYHRRAPPSPRHTAFKKLGPADRQRVRKLAAILRVADALDRGHRSRVRHLDIEIEAAEVEVVADGASDLALEVWTARRKASLFEEVFGLRFKLAPGG